MWDSASFWFSVASFSVTPVWLLMVLAPGWKGTSRLVASPLIAAGPLVVYALLVGPRLAVLAPALARPELPVIAGFLGTPVGAAIAWAHFLMLDLLAGRWIFLDGRARALPARVLSPVLALTLLFAPLGLGVYGVVLGVTSPAGRDLAARIWRGHRGLAVVALGSFVVMLAALAAQLFDHRLITGAPAWAKPAKFGASIALASASLAWILDQMPPSRGLRRAGTIMAAVAAAELVGICVQVARGVPSHFNSATPLDGNIFRLMGAAITAFWIAQIYMTVRAFKQPFATPARTWGIRLGLVAAVLSSGIAYIMAVPSAPQIASLRRGENPALMGGHTVGAPDGGPGLPVTRWSTEKGDLRVPHFLGLHALQLLPLAAVLLERRRRSTRLVLALGTAWISLTLITLHQALRAQPLLAPDALTLLELALALAGAAAVALWPARAALPRRTEALAP